MAERLRIGEAAALMGVTVKQLRGMANRGEVPYARDGDGEHRRFDRSVIEARRRELEGEPAATPPTPREVRRQMDAESSALFHAEREALERVMAGDMDMETFLEKQRAINEKRTKLFERRQRTREREEA